MRSKCKECALTVATTTTTSKWEYKMNDAGAANIGEATGQAEQSLRQINARTAFLVFQDEQGQWTPVNDPSFLGEHVNIEKIAHPDEIDAGCAAIRTDIASQKTAAMVQGLMMQAAKAAQEAQLNAAIMQQTGLKVK